MSLLQLLVHPHMRGEYFWRNQWITPPCGSSPHAWRILNAEHSRSGEVRFIPTCVENMFPANVMRFVGTVHPHMRGEYACCAAKIGSLYGSSPHAWRICDVAGICPKFQRFIPTCVENMSRYCPIAGRMSVHPHMRGEYEPSKPGMSVKGGSSPHAWRI